METKAAHHLLYHAQHINDLLGDLVWQTEDVGIILHIHKVSRTSAHTRCRLMTCMRMAGYPALNACSHRDGCAQMQAGLP